MSSDFTQELLCPLGVVTIPASQSFVVADHFVVNTSPDAPVCIGWMGENFRRYFLPKVEGASEEHQLSFRHLNRHSCDSSVLVELGDYDVAETTLYDLWELLTFQGRGQVGALLTNGCKNVFYVRDVRDVSWTLSVCWCCAWMIDAYLLHNPYGWRGGDQVFSQNPHDSLAP